MNLTQQSINSIIHLANIYIRQLDALYENWGNKEDIPPEIQEIIPRLLEGKKDILLVIEKIKIRYKELFSSEIDHAPTHIEQIYEQEQAIRFLLDDIETKEDTTLKDVQYVCERFEEFVVNAVRCPDVSQAKKAALLRKLSELKRVSTKKKE